MRMSKKYKFSIVMAIYNMESYLEEAIGSLLDQTIGFEDNLQVLFVNDGSTDRSGEICKKYAQQYPDNIIYIKKENGGVSSARNKGLQYAEGELVNFLDADDKLKEDALEKVYAFFEQHKEEVDLISIPLYFFEGKEGEHALNYKFTKTRVIDIFKEPKCFQMHISSSFIKLQEMRKYSFNPMLTLGEDAEVANKLILNKGKYGVVANTAYLYRKRLVGNSAIQGARKNKANYIPALKYLHLELVRFAKEKYTNVPEYLQWLMVYDIGGKIVVPYIDEEVLSQSETEEFLGYVKLALQDVEDRIILGREELRRYYNLYMLNIKYDGFQKEMYHIVGNKVEAALCRQDSIVALLRRQKLHVIRIERIEDKVKFFGYCDFIFDMYDYKIIIECNKTKQELTLNESEEYQVTSLNKKIAKGYVFEFELPVECDKNEIQAYAVLGKTTGQITVILEEEKKARDFAQSKLMSISENKQRNPMKLYIKRKIIPKYVAKALALSEKKSFSTLRTKKMINDMMKRVPRNCRDYLFNYRFNGENHFNIVFGLNKAWLYNEEDLLVARLEDVFVNLEKVDSKANKLLLKGSIMSPFSSSECEFYYCLNGEYKLCSIYINSGRSIRLKGKDKVECCEFELLIPFEKGDEIFFELRIKEIKVTPRIETAEISFMPGMIESSCKLELIDTKKIVRK